ncbi:voltage-gated potassium channel [Nitrosomonas cryotolerans]|uniref:Voltage-gated potassium channel n=1 Tax=Nitrosomonas cryotolerans ATCC 49181 TaxID=1131553 RepID=A0A1N6I7J5_9PROT|nr:ion transporter [Nitrosomonas cryotolerans]SFP97044.1 voltage-gated potassium channel [Nitrosomonas cryotolerans]SIO28008.1 voltage-gated potassium channel [Nitrosomonas cryotolerans ATCC 49181]
MLELNTRQKIYRVIFETDTPAGQRFDIFLIYIILLSVLAVMFDSIASVNNQFGSWLFRLEWIFTVLFSLEYMLRIYSSPKPLKYIFSFYGIVDLISIIPSYLALIIPEASYWLVVRLLRVLRIFRVLKMARHLAEANLLLRSIYQSRRKVLVFFTVILVISIIFGSLMFLVEGPEHGFTSIPKSIYWTIVTITTVGYGDITPQTTIGQITATLAMLTGYSIIAIPTGILTAEISNEMRKERSHRHCDNCNRNGHHNDASYCYHCGVQLPDSDI